MSKGVLNAVEAFKANAFCFINEQLVNAPGPFFTFLVDTLLQMSGKQCIIDNSCTLEYFRYIKAMCTQNCCMSQATVCGMTQGKQLSLYLVATSVPRFFFSSDIGIFHDYIHISEIVHYTIQLSGSFLCGLGHFDELCGQDFSTKFLSLGTVLTLVDQFKPCLVILLISSFTIEFAEH